MKHPIPVPTNLSDWTTRRLQLLLEDYTSALPGIRSLHGRGHPETRTFENWIRALEEELDKRHAR
jgi:hypothetical protein